MEVNEAIASAVSAILREGEFPSEMYSPKQVTVTAGTYMLTLHREMGVVHRVWHIDGNKRHKLDYIDLDKLDDEYRYDGSEPASGTPVMWTLNAGKVEVHPVPSSDTIIAMRGERKAGSIQNIPDAFRDAVVQGGLSFMVPAYIRPFERTLLKVKKYYRKQQSKKRQWRHGSTVRTHGNVRYDRNVI